VSRRTERVAEEIREEVARIISRDLKDPRVGFVTVTRAAITPDLRSARVYVGILGDAQQRRKTLEGLSQAAGFVKRTVAQRLRLRVVPELAFIYDEGLEATERVAHLLDEAQRGSDAPDEDPQGGDRGE
jgi:ribosome-binding factor A